MQIKPMQRHRKPQSTNLNVDCCQIIYTPFVLSMNQHQPNAVVAASYVVSAKISVKNCISDRHSSIRNSIVCGKWVCDQCDTLTQQAMPAYVIDKGIASPELLSHVLVSKYADHLPLYRQRLIYQRAGIELSRSTLSLAKQCFSDRSLRCRTGTSGQCLKRGGTTTAGAACR